MEKREDEMRRLRKILPILLCVGIGMATSVVSTSAGAKTHKIVATSKPSWKSGGQESNGRNRPLVLQVNKRDTIEITLPDGGFIHHGFVTINKKGNDNPAEAKDLVLACGQQPKPNDPAILRETGCQEGQPTKFGKNQDGVVGTITLEVLDNFPAGAAGVNFWCTVHREIMWGTLTLSSPARGKSRR